MVREVHPRAQTPIGFELNRGECPCEALGLADVSGAVAPRASLRHLLELVEATVDIELSLSRLPPAASPMDYSLDRGVEQFLLCNDTALLLFAQRWTYAWYSFIRHCFFQSDQFSPTIARIVRLIQHSIDWLSERVGIALFECKHHTYAGFFLNEDAIFYNGFEFPSFYRLYGAGDKSITRL